MIDLDTIQHHPALEEIVDVLCNKLQKVDRGFFRVEVAYFLAKMASSMRATIHTKDRGQIPVNVYAMALATSGYGKGHSVSIVENTFINGFKKIFMEETFGVLADQNMWKIAIERSVISGLDEEKEKEQIEKEFRKAGALPFTFDSGTTPAIKQLRDKLLLANAGSINLQIDEIGANLLSNVDILNCYLELYDQGMIKMKLVKNTAENLRAQDIDGKTPANTLLFGTPVNLLDGGITEDQFYSFLSAGYARRCIFGWGVSDPEVNQTLTPTEIYHRLTNTANSSITDKWNQHFSMLADPTKFGWEMVVEDNVGIALIEYKMECEKLSDTYPDHEEIRKAELSHRYFKALKLAGVYAFIDESSEITLDHLYAAIKLVEESGHSFQALLSREKPYVKLARFIASCKEELTHADLHHRLPYYKAGAGPRNEMMTLATAWGYKQNIMIRKTFADGIEFFTGETLEETNLDNIKISYSDHFAYNYNSEGVPFDKLHLLTQHKGLHWANHEFKNNHRTEENVIPGFNTVVIDVDGGVALSTVHNLMSNYTFMTYTTKRHTADENRFRLILPINYTLKLDQEDYREFMNSFCQWLPFSSDEAANQRSRKWETFDKGTYHYNTGLELVDCLKFVPKTSKNENHKISTEELASLDNLERWFAQRMATGNRNNLMIKYALALVDSGYSYPEVETLVLAFNAKLSNSLPLSEIHSTILQTVAKKIP